MRSHEQEKKKPASVRNVERFERNQHAHYHHPHRSTPARTQTPTHARSRSKADVMQLLEAAVVSDSLQSSAEATANPVTLFQPGGSLTQRCDDDSTRENVAALHTSEVERQIAEKSKLIRELEAELAGARNEVHTLRHMARNSALACESNTAEVDRTTSTLDSDSDLSSSDAFTERGSSVPCVPHTNAHHSASDPEE
eukprot:CAMPEP_0185845742 /NCGR_PEP_ID=MMETSP1354-20130828/1623_1 /TAXON_ID=708628 /ORGANISM="Erythrolobus madagascarensis, Strain CCMP3276" /LENGTH=196 /DNA_ID=CAMNT_0028545777 /DNA_START=466 /DNA_END=1056 /DNA_ORIENTATION=-